MVYDGDKANYSTGTNESVSSLEFTVKSVEYFL